VRIITCNVFISSMKHRFKILRMRLTCKVARLHASYMHPLTTSCIQLVVCGEVII